MKKNQLQKNPGAFGHASPGTKRDRTSAFFTTWKLALLIGALFLLPALLPAQVAYTISWQGLGGAGTTNATGVPAGISVIQQFNGVQATCNTSSNGATTSYSLSLQASPGYHFTITSIGGSAYASSAGSKQFTFQLANGSTYTQTNPTTIGSSSSCGGNTALNAFAVPAAGQLVNSGSAIVVTVLRAPGGASGGGYSWTRSLTISGTVTPDCSAPTGLAATNITTTGADLSWTAVSGSGGYEYVVDQSAAAPSGAGTTIATTGFSASGLAGGTAYYLHVRNNCGSGTFSSWTTIPFTTLTPCADPTGLAASNLTDTGADLSWNPVSGAGGYEYSIDQSAASPATAGTATTAVTVNASGLTFNTAYYLHVRSNCGSGNFSNWVTLPFTTTYPPCADPTGLVAGNINYNSATLSWNPVPASAGYEYVLDQSASDPSATGTATSDTFYLAGGLLFNTTYYIHVRNNCAAGNASNWTSISFTTPYPPCADPTGLTAVNITDNSALLSWDPAMSAAGYEYVIDMSAANPATGTAATDTFYAAGGLTFNTTYFMHIRTNCMAGNSSNWVTVSFTTLFPPCADPSGLVAAGITDNSATLSWNPLANAASYEYAIDMTAADPLTTGTVTTDTFYNAGLLSYNTTYYLHVRSNCMAGNSSGWTSLPFTTAYPACADPNGLVAANITDNSATLSWNPLANAAGYEYVVDLTATDPLAAGTITTDTFYIATNLSYNTSYYLHVRTNCAAGNTSGWTTLMFTTDYPVCADPTGLLAGNITDNSALLSWNPLANAAGYEYVTDLFATDPATAGTSVTDTFFTATGLQFNTTYYLHVRNQCAAGNTSGWVTISFTTAYPACTDPSGLTASNLTPNGGTLSWNAISNAAGYEYAIDLLATAPSGTGTLTADTFYVVSGLLYNATYYLHVRTDCSAGNTSGWTTIPFTTPYPPCASPVGVTASNITSTGASLSWNTGSGITGYEYVLDQTVTDPAGSGAPTPLTSFTASALTPNTTYYFHVRVNCTAGNSSSWTTISFTTSLPPCSDPSGVSITNISSSGADINWSASGGASGYEYVVDQVSSGPAFSGTPVTANSFNASGLTASTVYYVHIRSNCGNGNFSSWITVSFTTTSAVGILEAGNLSSTIRMYPNPVSQVLTIETGSDEKGAVCIITAEGKIILETESNSQSFRIDCSGLNPGVYSVRYTSGKLCRVARIIKQ